jgi:hypothetical protein
MKRLALLLALLLSLPSFAAPKMRSALPDLGAAATVSFKGTVTDAVTGLPVAYATITVGKNKSVMTTDRGTFSLKPVNTPGDIEVTAGRTGYGSSTIRVTGIGAQEVNFRLQSRPTATLKKANGTILALDDDSVTFGYIVPFMNYQTSTGNDFYMINGTRARIATAQIMRISGMGTSVPSAGCPRAGQRVLLELRDGTLNDATFVDSCYGYSVDVIARDHATGAYLYVPFAEVSEISF